MLRLENKKRVEYMGENATLLTNAYTSDISEEIQMIGNFEKKYISGSEKE
jgi:hypothetical protein